ncbi:hypothetical protein ACFLWA_07135 [Chloroflexota bacterium]
MTRRIILLSLALLLGTSLTACLPGRPVEVEGGGYTPIRGAHSSALAALRVDRDLETAWFELADGSQIILPLVAWPRAEWPQGCRTDFFSHKMEVLELDAESLTIGAAEYKRPVLVRNCPQEPVEVVLLSSGPNVGAGNGCVGRSECVRFDPARE